MDILLINNNHHYTLVLSLCKCNISICFSYISYYSSLSTYPILKNIFTVQTIHNISKYT